MSQNAIPLDVLDDHAAKLVLQIQEEYRLKSRCEEANFHRLASILAEMGKSSWALRPRTYTVLQMIGRLDVMDSFIEHGLRDIHFPFTEPRLPVSLSEMSDRSRFIAAQDHVLTAAKDVEDIEKGVHLNLKTPGDEYFFLKENLGRGSFGYVDRVLSRLSLNEFALKRSLRGKMFSKDKVAIRMFGDELGILKRLSHEHLVQYVGSYTDPKWLGILMTPVADCDLRQFLDRAKESQQQHLLRPFYGCLITAVHYLHQNRIRHKDLKPQNILLKGTKVLITDFGTSLDWNDDARATTSGDPGPISINYAAPEVVEKERRSESSDTWSLGCVFVEMTTVLKGRTNEDRKSFFTSHFTGASSYGRNSEALHSWLRQLESIPKDNITIAWITSMLQLDRTKRIAISLLADEILNYQGEYIYHGLCCADHSDSETSSHHNSPVSEIRSHAQSRTDFIASNNGQLRNEEVVADTVDAGVPSNVNSPEPAVDVNMFSTSAVPTVHTPAKGEHGGGFDPNPLPSKAIQAVDKLLGPRRINSGFDDARPRIQATNRVDALWQPAYLYAHSMSVPGLKNILPQPIYAASHDYYSGPIYPAGETHASGPSGGVETHPYYAPEPESNAQMENTTLHNSQRVLQRPSWDAVMSYTGISRCKGW